MTDGLTVEMLGHFEVRRSDRVVVESWARPSAKRFFSLLLLTRGQQLDRAAAAHLLFPELSPPRALNALAKATHWCRDALGSGHGDAVVAQRGLLRWTGCAEVDACTALRVVRDGGVPASPAELRALADDTRPLLPEWDDEWLHPFRDELRQARRTASAALAQHLEAGPPQELAEAARRWQHLVHENPLEGSHRAGLLRTLLTTGDVEAAQAAYTACRRTWWAELGVEPDPQYEALWRAGTACESPGTYSGWWSPPRAETEGRRSPSLLGREAVVDLIEQQLVQAERGQGARVAVVGEAGVGKSAVLGVLADRWRSRGWRVIEGFGRNTDSSGYAAIADALRAVSTGTHEESFVERLVAQAPSSPLPDTRRQSSEQSLHLRVARILEAAARVPLLLVVDDLHGADPATSRLLDGLGAIGQNTHWSLLMSTRSNPGASARVVHHLEPLADGVIETIIRGHCRHLTDDALARAVSRSRGNPLFAHEIAQLLLADSGAASVPPSAFELLRERLHALPRRQRALVPLVALAGSDATWSVVCRAVTRLAPGTSPHDFAETLQRLFDAGLVMDREGLLVASHPLIGEAAIAMLNRSRRAQLHDALAAALDASGLGTSGAGPHRLAAFDALPDPARAGWAVQAAADAAQHALEQGRNQMRPPFPGSHSGRGSCVTAPCRSSYTPDSWIPT